VRGAGRGRIGGDGLLVGGLRDDHVVTHRSLRQLAGMDQVDGEFVARLVNHDFLRVELHGVVAFNGDVTLSRHGGNGHDRQQCGESDFCEHMDLRVVSITPMCGAGVYRSNGNRGITNDSLWFSSGLYVLICVNQCAVTTPGGASKIWTCRASSTGSIRPASWPPD